MIDFIVQVFIEYIIELVGKKKIPKSLSIIIIFIISSVYIIGAMALSISAIKVEDFVAKIILFSISLFILYKLIKIFKKVNLIKLNKKTQGT